MKRDELAKLVEKFFPCNHKPEKYCYCNKIYVDLADAILELHEKEVESLKNVINAEIDTNTKLYSRLEPLRRVWEKYQYIDEKDVIPTDYYFIFKAIKTVLGEK